MDFLKEDFNIETLSSLSDEELCELLDSDHAIDIAEIVEDMNDEELTAFIKRLSYNQLAFVVEQSSIESSLKILNNLDDRAILQVFSHMSKDDIVDILGDMKIARQKSLINLMKKSDQEVIRTLLSYKDDSAGGIMTTEYCVVKAHLSIQKAIDKLKEIAPKTEVIDTIFVTDNKNELIGIVNLRDILVTPYSNSIADIMDTDLIYVHPEDDQEEVSLLVSKYDLKAMPVVNHKKQLIGIITIDDIIDVIVEEHNEDMMRMAGVSSEEDIETPIISSIKLRLPWLLVNLVTAFIAAFTVSIFSDVITKVVALAAINPIIAGMGGNAGAQELSIIIRSITMGEAELKDSLPLIYKQFVIGLVNGLIIGLITGGIMAIFYKNIYLLIIILLAMIINLILAGVSGLIIPLTLKALKIDPALASSIFLTTVTDVCGFFAFLGLAQLFIHKLI